MLEKNSAIIHLQDSKDRMQLSSGVQIPPSTANLSAQYRLKRKLLS